MRDAKSSVVTRDSNVSAFLLFVTGCTWYNKTEKNEPGWMCSGLEVDYMREHSKPFEIEIILLFYT